MKKVLFFPSYSGNGFGHISRCLALGDEMTKRGWQVAFAAAGHHVPTIRKSAYKVFQPVFPTRPKESTGNSPAYIFILDGSMQVLRDCLISPFRLRMAVIEGLFMISRFKPDILVGDTSLLTWILGRRAGLPVVQIVRSMMLPGKGRIIWWEDPPTGIVSPDIHPVFDKLLRKWGLPGIDRAEELLRGDLYLVPNIPELEPVEEKLDNIYHVGPIVREIPSPGNFPDLLGEKGQKRIYITIGGGAGPVGNKQFFEIVKEAFSQTSWFVVVSTGRKFRPDNLGPSPKNIVFRQWVPGGWMISTSDAVVFHGGYGTMMEVVQNGTPSVIIPFHSEQESNAQRLAAFSAAKVLSPSSDNKQRRLIHRSWRYGHFSYCVLDNSPLLPVDLLKAVSEVIEDAKYKDGAVKLKKTAESYRGSQKAVELIEQMVSGHKSF